MISVERFQMSVNNPKISVLIPVYNGAAYLRPSIESILNQTFTDFELLLLDDASTDNSAEIIKSYTDSRIKFFQSEKNLGISAARNKLMDLAQGEYLAVMDHDDLSAPTRLAEQFEFMERNPEVAMLGTWGQLFCAEPPFEGFLGKLKQKFINLGWVWCQPQEPDIYETLCGNPIMHSSSMLRRSALIKSKIAYNQTYSPAEDYDLCRQILAQGWKLANLQKVLFFYHYHGKNHSLTHKQAMIKADYKVKSDILKLLGKKFAFRPYFWVILRKLRLKRFLRNYND